MHSAAAAHGFAYDTMRRAEAYRHPLDPQDSLALQHPLAVAASNNEQQVKYIITYILCCDKLSKLRKKEL